MKFQAIVEATGLPYRNLLAVTDEGHLVTLDFTSPTRAENGVTTPRCKATYVTVEVTNNPRDASASEVVEQRTKFQVDQEVRVKLPTWEVAATAEIRGLPDDLDPTYIVVFSNGASLRVEESEIEPIS